MEKREQMKDVFHSGKCLTPEEITGYLHESLPEDELHKIEQHLLDCELCNAAIEGWSKVGQQETVMAELEAVKLEASDVKPAKNSSEKRKTFSVSPSIWAAAATIALLISILLFFIKPDPTPTALFEKYYEPVTMPDPTTRSYEETVVKELALNAFKAYRAKDFAGAIPLFDQILQIDRKNPVALYFGGIACLETGQNEKAIMTLDKLASQPGAQYAEDANWYLALALLRQKDLERCKEVLSGIARNDGYFAGKASELVEKMEGL